MSRRLPLHAADLRALSALATDATGGVTDIAEAVHAAVWRTLGVRAKTPGRTRGITGGVYRAVRAITRLVGRGVDAVLGLVRGPDRESTRERDALVAALNGVLGDRLDATANPLATETALHVRGEATGRILLLVHGVCMNDAQWTWPHEGAPVDHGQTLARHGWTPVYARYNSGLHISQNGGRLAREIDRLVAGWPVPVDEVAVVAHSMGGLVVRSAVHQARGARWARLLSRVVFLGTPHHGAPLERIGNTIDTLLAKTRFSRPFAAIGQIRSAGVTDLRYGLLTEADWQGRDRFARHPDTREIVPLPEGVACYAVAATVGRPRGRTAERTVGDGLVPLQSALGQHAQATRTLAFRDTLVVPDAHHFDLLSHPLVERQLVAWLGAPTPSS